MTLEAGGDVEAVWPQYLGEYQPTEETHNGAQVYVNSEGLLLYVTDKGDWSANTVINNRGVLRGADTGNRSEPCVAAVAEWRYWDEDQWTPADISVSCDTGEQGRDMIQTDITLLISCPCPGPAAAEEAGQDYSHLSSCWSPHTQTCYFVSRAGMNWDRAGQVGRNTEY